MNAQQFVPESVHLHSNASRRHGLRMVRTEALKPYSSRFEHAGDGPPGDVSEQAS